MNNPNDVPVLDLEVFKGISYELDFQAQYATPEGQVTGAIDLTNKNIVGIFRGVWPEDVVIQSATGDTPYGSFIRKTVPVDGTFKMHLTGVELGLLVSIDGDWRIELREGNNADLIVRGSVVVVPFGGEGI